MTTQCVKIILAFLLFLLLRLICEEENEETEKGGEEEICLRKKKCEKERTSERVDEKHQKLGRYKLRHWESKRSLKGVDENNSR